MIAIAIAGLTSLTVSAADLTMVQIPNGHGQSTSLYRAANEQSVALFVGGSNVAAKAVRGPVTTIPHYDGHGESQALYREVR